MNALELAEQLEAGGAFPAYPSMPLVDAADMLRRQHEAIQKLREALQNEVIAAAQQALKDTDGL